MDENLVGDFSSQSEQVEKSYTIDSHFNVTNVNDWHFFFNSVSSITR